MIRVTFSDTASRDAFADRFNLETKVDSLQLDIGWHLLQFAKLDPTALDYDELQVLQSGANASSEREFIVKGNPETFSAHATVVKDLGNGFYLVKSADGTMLGDYVDSIEHNSAPMTFLNVGTITGMNSNPTDLSPESSEAQWARIRIASRYRPLATSFGTHEMIYQSKPELYVMDSGINFNHPEFQYEGLETENFYTLPIFNGVFDDDVGHGTGVASLAVGKNLGISAHCKLINIKVGSQTHNATLLEIGEAIDAIVARASADPLKTRIVNMSWGIARSSWLDAKVQSLLDLGITVVCAAGNQGISVEDISPAGLDTVITVGSIDRYDIPSGFNNISPSDVGLTTGTGLSLDIFAPGEMIVIASVNGGYEEASGTSFSAPLVAGVAATIASLHAGFVPYSDLKATILNTATKDALLFEDDKFSENQNNLLYLFTADPNTNYKSNEMTTYLGVHNETTQEIVADLNSAVDTSFFNTVFPTDPVVWSLEFFDDAIKNTYSPFMHLDSVTGILTIDKPVTSLPEETKLKMVEFKAIASTSRTKAESTVLFFFDTNPLYKDTLESDVTLALTDTNSISFYAAWGKAIK